MLEIPKKLWEQLCHTLCDLFRRKIEGHSDNGFISQTLSMVMAAREDERVMDYLLFAMTDFDKTEQKARIRALKCAENKVREKYKNRPLSAAFAAEEVEPLLAASGVDWIKIPVVDIFGSDLPMDVLSKSLYGIRFFDLDSKKALVRALEALYRVDLEFGTLVLEDPIVQHAPKMAPPSSNDAEECQETETEPEPKTQYSVPRQFEGEPNIILVYPGGSKTPARCRISLKNTYAIIEPSKNTGAFYVVDVSALPKEGLIVSVKEGQFLRLYHTPSNLELVADFMKS
jgi:hypothetical protein